MNNLKSDSNYGTNLYNFTTPDQILIATPLSSGAFNLELDIYNNVIVKDLISGKNYRGSLSISQDYIKFDNGMIGRVNSDVVLHFKFLKVSYGNNFINCSVLMI